MLRSSVAIVVNFCLPQRSRMIHSPLKNLHLDMPQAKQNLIPWDYPQKNAPLNRTLAMQHPQQKNYLP